MCRPIWTGFWRRMWIRKNRNETIYLVGSESEAHWQEQMQFSHILEAERTGGLPFCAALGARRSRDWIRVGHGRKSE